MIPNVPWYYVQQKNNALDKKNVCVTKKAPGTLILFVPHSRLTQTST